MVKRAAWLSITPEPERELPRAVAVLRRGGPAAPADVERERERIERLLLRGTQRQWLRYLHEVVGLITSSGGAEAGDAAVADARRTAAVVISNHHNLLLALPGRGARLSARDRGELDVAVAQRPTTTKGPV